LGIVSSSALIIKFDDLQHCRVRVNLAYAPPEVIQQKKQQCCMRFMGPNNPEYACLDELNCEYTLYQFARRFNEKCALRKDRQVDDVYTEVNTGNNAAILGVIKNVFKSEVKYTNIKKLNPGDSISTEEFKVKHKTLVIKFLFRIKQLIHDANIADVKKGKKLNQTPNDTTPPDPPSNVFSGVVPRYTAESEYFDIIAGKTRVVQYKEKSTGDLLIIMDKNQFIKTKEFEAIVLEKSNYVLLIYEDNNAKVIMEIGKGILITNDSSHLGESYKSKIFIYNYSC
jgi:hypothetical protein